MVDSSTPELPSTKPRAWPRPNFLPELIDVDNADFSGMTRNEIANVHNLRQYMRYLRETIDNEGLPIDIRHEASRDLTSSILSSAGVYYPHMEAQRILDDSVEFGQRRKR